MKTPFGLVNQDKYHKDEKTGRWVVKESMYFGEEPTARWSREHP